MKLTIRVCKEVKAFHNFNSFEVAINRVIDISKQNEGWIKGLYRSREEKMTPDIADIIEVVTDIPEKNLRAGVRGAVVHCHGEGYYEIEFADKNGETLDISALHTRQFIVVWRAKTRQWIPVADQTSAIVAGLPDDAARQVLNFARFLSAQTSKHREYENISA